MFRFFSKLSYILSRPNRVHCFNDDDDDDDDDDDELFYWYG